MAKHAKQIGLLGESVPEINNRLQRIENSLGSATTSSLDPNSLSAIKSELSSLQNQAQLVKQSFNVCAETIASARIPVSLKRFDDWFRLFQKSQNRRWLVFNVLTPFLLFSHRHYFPDDGNLLFLNSHAERPTRSNRQSAASAPICLSRQNISPVRSESVELSIRLLQDAIDRFDSLTPGRFSPSLE